MNFKTILYSIDEDGVALLKLNRPDSLNALSGEMFHELSLALTEIERNSSIRCVLLTGAGRAFCAGGDLEEMKQGFNGNSGFYHHMEEANRFIAALAECNKPVVAAVNGAATGAGMNIALAADIVIASDRAKFSEIFGNVGLIPDVGGTYLLSRIVGRAKAKEIVFSYRMINAQEALALGLVHKVVSSDTLRDEAYEMAKHIAEGPTFAFSMAKKIINRSSEIDLHTALQMEAFAQALAGNSADHKEGVNAFFEKRPHHFKGE